MIHPFWRDSELTTKEQELVEALFAGHSEAAKRQNISSEVLKAAYIGSGDFNQSVAAAVSTLGGIHAPIIDAYDNLHFAVTPPPPWFATNKIAGWGNSFVKGKPDPIWKHTHDTLTGWPAWTWKIDKITNFLHDLGKNVYPNAACYTAAVASAIGMPREISPALVHCGRIWTWAELIYDTARKASSEELRDN